MKNEGRRESQIFGASKPEHVTQNAECVNYHLEDAVMREVGMMGGL